MGWVVYEHFVEMMWNDDVHERLMPAYPINLLKQMKKPRAYVLQYVVRPDPVHRIIVKRQPVRFEVDDVVR